MSKEKELILEAKHVTKKFPLTKGKELIANDDVSLKFYKGQTLGIVGESGCGKSTFMRMMVQLEQPTSGEILFKGKDITKMKGEELRKNRRNVQMVFQNPSTSFNPKMKVGDIICEPLMNFGLIKKKEKDAVARKYLEMVELPGDFADRYPHNMSGGQRQRVAIARALALEPEILILDEPTTGLDPQTRKTLWHVIEKLREEEHMTVFLTTHYMEEAAAASYVVILDKGSIIAEGTPHELKEKYVEDTISLYGVTEEEVKSLGKPYKPIRDGYQLTVSSTLEATELIVTNRELFRDYEVVKGGMDDVFLAATGKVLGGDEK